MQIGNKRQRTEGSEAGDHQLRFNKEISRTQRHLPPAHYSLKVQSYSFLSRTEKYESGVFEAGGFKWRLLLYPNGDKKKNGENFISLYLAILETDTFPVRWEVNVNFKLFVHDQLEDQYLTIQDANGAVKRFHEMKTTWGFEQLLPLETFKDPSNGYLVDDTCVFGAEVLVIKQTGNWESLSFVKAPYIRNSIFTWEVDNFSKLNEDFYQSEAFLVGRTFWKLKVYPNGANRFKGKALSLYLAPTLCECGSNNATKAATYAVFMLRLLDEVNCEHLERSVSCCFNPSDMYNKAYGFGNFVSLENLHNPSNGFLENDAVVVEVEFLLISESRYFSERANKNEEVCITESEKGLEDVSQASSVNIEDK